MAARSASCLALAVGCLLAAAAVSEAASGAARAEFQVRRQRGRARAQRRGVCAALPRRRCHLPLPPPAHPQSCSGCQLNRLPEVKRFLKEQAEAGKWARVGVTWIGGAPPELVLFDGADAEVERMSISQLSYADLETLLASKGFEVGGAGSDTRGARGGACGVAWRGAAASQLFDAPSPAPCARSARTGPRRGRLSSCAAGCSRSERPEPPPTDDAPS